MDIALFIQVLVNGIVCGGVYALVASGFTLILGVMRIFNFAQGEFYMLGAFATYGIAVALGLPYVVALLITFVAMGVLGVLVYIGIIRWTYAGFFHTVLATIAFGTIATQSSLLTYGYREKVMAPVLPGTLVVADITLPWGKILIIGLAIVVMVALYYFMKLKLGTAMRAVAENADVASLQGINTRYIFWLTMGIGCALSGIAGGLVAPVLAASVEMGHRIFIRALLVVFVGGMGSMTGALLAALIIGIIESFGYQFIGELNMLAIFGVLAILIYFRPGGLLGKPLPIPEAE